MITKTMIQQLERKFIKVRNENDGGFTVLQCDMKGKFKNSEGKLLTDDEVEVIREDCKNSGKQLIRINCWTTF